MTAPGIGWEPPVKFTQNDQLTSAHLNSIAEQLARLSRFSAPGLFNGIGNFPDGSDDVQPGISLKFWKLQTILPPGSLSFPTSAMAYPVGAEFEADETLLKQIFNVFPTIAGAPETTVATLTFLRKDVAIAAGF